MAARNDSLFDDAAEESDDQQQGVDEQNEGGDIEERASSPAGSDVDSSEEEEGGNEYDMTDKFIAPEDEEEAGEESESDEEGGRRKKRKRRRREEEELDEEDFALLEEQGVRVDNIRRKQAAQRKRIRQKKDETAARQSARTAEEQVQHELFGEDADAGLEDEPEDTAPAQQERQTRYDDEGLDSEDDFIDDDIGEGAQGQRPRRARSKIRTDGVHSQAVQEAFDIFGDVGDLLEIYDQRKREEADGADEEQEPDFSDEEAAETFKAEQEDRRAKRAFEKLAGKIEPGMMAKHFMRPEDNTIRTTDVPEREQQYRGPDPSNMDFQAMALWVYRKLMGLGGNGETELTSVVEAGVREVDGGHWHYRDLQEATRDTDLSLGFRGITRYRSQDTIQQWQDDAQAQAQLRTSVETVLRHIYEDHFEVPFIAMHRKEGCGELLAIDEDFDVEEDDRDYRHPRVTPRENDSAKHPAGTMQAHHRYIRQWRVLNSIQALGDKWRAVERRKDRQRQAFDTAIGLATDIDFQQGLKEAKEQIDQAASIEEVEDLERQLRLMSDNYSALAAANGMGQLTLADRGRSSHKVSAHSIAKKAGLGPAVAAVFLQPSEFGENLETSTLQNAVNDPQQPPEDLTAQYFSEGFATMERVLEGIHKIAVADMVAEASVRKHIRELYMKYAVVSTAPTLSGESVLNPFHPYGTVRHLRNKPVAKFTDDDQYLLIAAAEKEGLLKVTFKVRRPPPGEQTTDVLLEQTKELYCSQSVSTTATAWNELREKVLVDALDSFFKPQFERELRSKLISDARDYACLKCSRHIWRLAVEGPVALKDRHNHDLDDRKFMVAIWAPGGQGPSTTFVMLDLEGNVVDMLYCGQLSGNIVKLRDYSPREREEQQASRKFDERFLYQRHIEDDPRKGKDLRRLYDFVLEHVPNVMLVATTGQYAEVLFSYVSALKDVVVSKNAQLLTSNSESGRIDIKWADQSVAQVWENSTAAKEELTDQPVLVRRAVAIGRTAIYGQLPILCSLAGPTREILALSMHPMQKAISKEELFKAAERAVVSAVTQIGVNLNLVSQTPWMTPQLQFVPGLGPRKALALLKWAQRQDHVNARRPLYRDVTSPLGKKVFWNAAPVLRIKRSLNELVQEPDPLDDTRISSEHYTLAVSMCAKALEGSKYTFDDDDVGLLVEKAMQERHHERILSLDLVQMNQQLREEAEQEDRDYIGSLTLLIDIRFELLAPFKDLRRVNLRDLSITEAFWLLSGETEDTLKPGRRVQATIQGLSAMAAFCTLPDVRDMEAVISSSDISSSGEVRPDSRLRRGDTIPARIKRVIGRRDDRQSDQDDQAGGTSRIYLVTTSTAMADEQTWEDEYCTDRYYEAPTEEDRAKLQAERNRSQRKQQFVSRTIFHPSFKNVSMPEAIALLGKEGETSRWLFRPSNKGTHQISITMKLHTGPDGNDLFLHQDIREGRKQAGGVGGHLKLGSPLTIQMAGSAALTFEDLDDVIANFAEPYLENVRALVTHRKFMDGQWDTVQTVLSAERARPAYKLGIRYEQPGIFYLAFVLRTTPARENFSVLPSGYYYRKKVFSTIDAAIDKFKRQPINPETQQAMPSHNQAAYQYPVAATNAAYPDTSYPATAAPAQYTGAPYDASAYAGQYAAYPQQQYQQPYAPAGSAAVANVPAAVQGGSTGYDQQSYAYAQQPAAAQAPPSDGSWLAQYQTSTADYSGYPYQQAGQPAYDTLNTQQYAAVGQPPPPPTEVPPPPPV
ncbi:hypothetical protein ABBQ32_010098 [Trebouxia sp. C0010 RCD-2024]